MKCANCLQIIKEGEEIVYCTNSNQPLHKECANPCVECGKPLSDVESLANKFKCKNCTKDNVVQIESVRRSYIENYKTCPYMFKKLAIDKVEVPNNPYAENGIILHDIFDKASNDKSITKEMMVKEYTDEYAKIENFKEYQIKKNLPKTLYEKGLICIDNFIKYNNSAPEPFATEEKILYNIGEDLPKIQITFDRINKIGDKLHLIDYKTGKVHVGKKLSSDLQIPTYIMAVKEKYGVYPETFTLLFLSEGKERIYNRVNDKTYVCKVRNREYVVNIQEKITEIQSIFSKIKQGRFEIPVGKLSPWYCENRCALYEKHCAGVEDQPWKKYNKQTI